MTSCRRVEIFQRFARTFCLHRQGRSSIFFRKKFIQAKRGHISHLDDHLICREGTGSLNSVAGVESSNEIECRSSVFCEGEFSGLIQVGPETYAASNTMGTVSLSRS